jgi:hypothetical protein
VELSLNRREVTSSDELVLTVKNYGFKWISLGFEHRIYREYPNGSLIEVDFPPNVAWPAVLSNIAPLIGSHHERVYIKHLEPGEYRLKKEFTIIDVVKYFKTINFTATDSK